MFVCGNAGIENTFKSFYIFTFDFFYQFFVEDLNPRIVMADRRYTAIRCLRPTSAQHSKIYA